MRSDRGQGRLIAGRYQLHEVLGRGGMGTVWRAHDQLLDRPVAAKELHILATGDEEHRIRLRRATREARAVAKVPHPHVVGVHDLVEAEDRLWIVMELVEGPSLAHHLARTGSLSPRHTAAIGLQLLDALEAVHAVGALHRDVKPANVLLRRDGNAVLTDFGIAALDDGDFLTSTGELVGSLEFMAPERVTGTEAGPASDLWSLGVTLATVCGGRSPFRRPAGPATLHAVAYEEPALPPQLGPLRPVVEALLRKSPGDRPTAAVLRSELRHVAAGEPVTGPLPPATARARQAPSPVRGFQDPQSPRGFQDPQSLRGFEDPQSLRGFEDPATAHTHRAPATAHTHQASAPAHAHRGPAPFADADTVTWDGHRAAVRDEPVPTAWSTTSLGPARREPPAKAGRRRWWWALAGTAVLAAGALTGLFLAGAPPFTKDPETTTVTQVVQSATGWQPVSGVSVRRGDRVVVRYVSGQWTADHRNWPLAGPAGYDKATDESFAGAADCKVKPGAPFASLLAVLAGVKDAPVHTVGRQLDFRAAGAGTLQLGMNDTAGACSEDNRGTLTVRVSVTRRN